MEEHYSEFIDPP